MERPERNQNAETEKQQREDEVLRVHRQRIGLHMLDDGRDVEGVRTTLQIQGDQADQGDQRTDAQINRDLEGGEVLLFAAAPDANHDKGRHQRQFMEKIEEEQVQRGERPEDAARHDEQQHVKFFFAGLDFPRAEGRGQTDNRAHQDQADIQAIYPDVIADAEGLHPGDLLHKAEAIGIHGRGRVLAEHPYGGPGGEQGAQDGDGADDDAIIARDKDQRQCRQQRPTCDVSQNGHFIFQKPKPNRAPRPRPSQT